MKNYLYVYVANHGTSIGTIAWSLNIFEWNTPGPFFSSGVGVLLLFSDALGLCPFGGEAYI